MALSYTKGLNVSFHHDDHRDSPCHLQATTTNKDEATSFGDGAGCDTQEIPVIIVHRYDGCRISGVAS